MKITMRETEIIADARELRESNTLASNVERMLSRVFKSYESFDDEEESEEDEIEGDEG